jgi:hypothetical protein
MKKVYYLFGTFGAIMMVAISIFIARKIESQKEKDYSDLKVDWEKTFEKEHQLLFDNYGLIADKAGYYDYGKIGQLIGSNPEFETISDRWDGLSLQAIIVTDKNNMMFQEPDVSSITDGVWYAYGDNWELLRKNNFEINQVIKGRNNWFYLRTRRS